MALAGSDQEEAVGFSERHPLSTTQTLGPGGPAGLLLPSYRGEGRGAGGETGRQPHAGWHVDRLVRPELLGEKERSSVIPGVRGAWS